MSVKLFSIALSGLFFLTQAQEMGASDSGKDESPRKVGKRLLPPSPTIKPETLQKEQEKPSGEETKSSKKKPETSFSVAASAAVSSQEGTPKKKEKRAAAKEDSAKNPEDLFSALLSKTQPKKKENFSPPKTLDVYETLLVLLAGYHGADPVNVIYNKVYLAKHAKACNFVSLHKKTKEELSEFLHFGQILKNEGFAYLKEIYLIKDDKAAVISTKAEEITKNLRSTEEITQKLSEAQRGQKKYTQGELDKLQREREEIQAGQDAFKKIEGSRQNLDRLLIDLNPGNNKNRSLSELTAEYEYDEKRPFSTLAGHDSVYGWYRLYVRNEPTDFVFGVQLYRMASK